MDVDEPVGDADREPDLGEDPPDEVREEDQEDDDEEEGEKEVAEIVYQLARLAVDGRVEQTVHEDVEVDPGHEDSGEEGTLLTSVPIVFLSYFYRLFRLIMVDDGA